MTFSITTKPKTTTTSITIDGCLANMEKDIVYTEPEGYFPKEILDKYFPNYKETENSDEKE